MGCVAQGCAIGAGGASKIARLTRMARRKEAPMGRGLVAACLAITLCHGLSSGQTPPIGGPGAGVPLVAPLAPEPVVPPTTADHGEHAAVAHSGGAVGDGGIKFWAGVEYLLWFVQEPKLAVPLVTSGVLTNDPGGVLRESGTRVILGNQSVNDEPYHGVRGRLGVDVGDSGLGFEAVGFVLNQQSTKFHFPSATVNPDVLSIPVNNLDLATEAVLRVRDPGRVDGTVDVNVRTNFSGAEGNIGYAVNAGVIDWAYIGYRYLNLTEALAMQTNFLVLADGLVPFKGAFQPVGTAGQITESFSTRNDFNGGQFGLVKRLAYRNVSLDVRTSVAFGETRQRLTIAGVSGIGTQAGNVTTITQTAPGGIFAQPSNIGKYVTNQFSVVPEVGASVYVRMLDGILGYVGYNFLYWTNVVRPGEQIDRNVELQQTPFSTTFTGIQTGRPTVTSRRNDLTVHGLNAGLAIQF